MVQFVIYYLPFKFYKSAFKCYQCTLLCFIFLYIIVSMHNSYDWLILLCLIFVLVCPYLLILGGMLIVYVMIYSCLWTNYYVAWKRLMDYEGMLSTFCDYLHVCVIIFWSMVSIDLRINYHNYFNFHSRHQI